MFSNIKPKKNGIIISLERIPPRLGIRYFDELWETALFDKASEESIDLVSFLYSFDAIMNGELVEMQELIEAQREDGNIEIATAQGGADFGAEQG